QPYCDAGAFAQAALQLQHAMMKLHDVLDDRETETGAAKLARARPIDTVEAFRQTRYVGRRNALAGIGNDQLDARPSGALPRSVRGRSIRRRPRFGRDTTAARRILERVVE